MLNGEIWAQISMPVYQSWSVKVCMGKGLPSQTHPTPHDPPETVFSVI